MPAYLIGLVLAGFLRDRIIVDRLRTISFALLTPFFFIRAGLLVSYLHHASDGHRAHVRLDRRALRSHQQPGHPGAVQRPGHRGDPLPFVPTLIAQQWFEPDLEGLDEEVEDTAGNEDLATLHHPHHRAESPGREREGETPTRERP